MRYAKYLTLFFLCLFCVSCINSKWLLSIFYNRLDNKVLSEVTAYADFNKEQTQEIKDRAKRFHHWHRTTQLPRYAEFIQTVAKEITSEQGLDFSQIEFWAKEIEQMVADTNNCHPMMFSFGLMKSLDDTQVGQVKERMIEQYTERRERYNGQSQEERKSKRLKKTLAWLKRFKFDLDAEELTLLNDSFASQMDLSEQAFSLWKDWDDHFYELLLSRGEQSFEGNARAHIDQLSYVLEQNYPSEVQINRQVWRTFFYQITLDESQSSDSNVPKFLEKLAKNISAISIDIPRSQLDWDASDYCS